MRNLELWGGCECTVNRVGDRFLDQTVMSGHQERISDLDLFAELGFTAMRYPVLWERTAPERPDQFDWSWADERLNRLRRLGIRPIAGLVHHGSGPRYTSLIDPHFAEGLARYAGAVAERYPWIRDWTPVNEPLTTARFSALYGHWHPHAADERSFWTVLLNEIDGVRLAMKAIRRVIPGARLIQTEDFGRTYSTAPLAYQAEFENTRRWMTWDLLEGRVEPGHPMWERLSDWGLADRLRAIADDPCPPDVLGVNHYLTSTRFLDHRLERYPARTHGRNFFEQYADIEAARVLHPAPNGLETALQEIWARYGRTIAVTECHNGCTRDEQMRWLQEAWDTAGRLRRWGVDVEAVTVWSLLGAFDWNSLLTRQDGFYESGVYDLTAGFPRPTAMTGLIKRLACGRRCEHPAAQGEGWWRRDVRFEHPPVVRSLVSPGPQPRSPAPQVACPPLLIAGRTGALGVVLARACEWRALDYILVGRDELPLDDPRAIDRALAHYKPWAVVNAAGWSRVDAAEADPQACRRANVEGALALARACRRRGLPLVSFSSDQVFDGRLGRALVERDETAPLNAYGRSKAEMEAELLALGGRNLIVRTAAFFSPFDPRDFAAQVAHRLREGQRTTAAGDLIASPTYAPDLANGALDLLIDGETGIWHLASAGALSWFDFAQTIARALDLDTGLLRAAPAESFGWAAARPAYVPLASHRGALLRPVEDAIGRWAAAMQADGFGVRAPAVTARPTFEAA